MKSKKCETCESQEMQHMFGFLMFIFGFLLFLGVAIFEFFTSWSLGNWLIGLAISFLQWLEPAAGVLFVIFLLFCWFSNTVSWPDPVCRKHKLHREQGII